MILVCNYLRHCHDLSCILVTLEQFLTCRGIPSLAICLSGLHNSLKILRIMFHLIFSIPGTLLILREDKATFNSSFKTDSCWTIDEVLSPDQAFFKFHIASGTKVPRLLWILNQLSLCYIPSMWCYITSQKISKE